MGVRNFSSVILYSRKITLFSFNLYQFLNNDFLSKQTFVSWNNLEQFFYCQIWYFILIFLFDPGRSTLDRVPPADKLFKKNLWRISIGRLLHKINEHLSYNSDGPRRFIRFFQAELSLVKQFLYLTRTEMFKNVCNKVFNTTNENCIIFYLRSRPKYR